jgi:hypothetical protein
LNRNRNQSTGAVDRNALIFGFFAMREPARSEMAMPA